jgi:hypothetical protein
MVTIQVDGGGQDFNAMGATVVVTGPVTVQSLTLATTGDCAFPYLTDPTKPTAYTIFPVATSPSFAVALLGRSSPACTLYTMTLNPTGPGTISINLIGAQVLIPPAGAEILAQSGVINGSYTVASASNTPVLAANTPAHTTTPAAIKMQTVTVTAAENGSSDNTHTSAAIRIVDCLCRHQDHR